MIVSTILQSLRWWIFRVGIPHTTWRIHVLGSLSHQSIFSGYKIEWRACVVAYSCDSKLLASRTILAGIWIPPIPWPMTKAKMKETTETAGVGAQRWSFNSQMIWQTHNSLLPMLRRRIREGDGVRGVGERGGRWWCFKEEKVVEKGRGGGGDNGGTLKQNNLFLSSYYQYLLVPPFLMVSCPQTMVSVAPVVY